MKDNPSPATPRKTAHPYTQARRRLTRCDPILAAIIQRVGTCRLQPEGDPFRSLTRSIVAQLISTQAARTIYGRLEVSLASNITPRSVLDAGQERLRSVGLSTAKATAILDLAQRIHTGALAVQRLPEMDDEEVIAQLVPIRGIGRWTAEMFLIFCLGRPDVLPVADLGLRAGVQQHWKLSELPGRRVLGEIGEVWRPYRSIATWYIWRSRAFSEGSAAKPNGA